MDRQFLTFPDQECMCTLICSYFFLASLYFATSLKRGMRRKKEWKFFRLVLRKDEATRHNNEDFRTLSYLVLVSIYNMECTRLGVFKNTSLKICLLLQILLSRHWWLTHNKGNDEVYFSLCHRAHRRTLSLPLQDCSWRKPSLICPCGRIWRKQADLSEVPSQGSLHPMTGPYGGEKNTILKDHPNLELPVGWLRICL